MNVDRSLPRTPSARRCQGSLSLVKTFGVSRGRCIFGQDKNCHRALGVIVAVIGMAESVFGGHSGHIILGVVISALGFIWAEIVGHWCLLPRFAGWVRSQRMRHPTTGTATGKRDWTKPQMRLSMAAFSNDFLGFLLFLRLVSVTLLCVFGPILTLHFLGSIYGALASTAAYVLWWFHFGLSGHHTEGNDFFSRRFCLLGYVLITMTLVASILMVLGILPQGVRAR